MLVTKNMFENLLKSKIVKISFKKKDGTERIMKCSLRSDVVPAYEKKTEKKASEDVLVVWDLDKEAFRSFRLDSLLDYQVIQEGYEL